MNLWTEHAILRLLATGSLCIYSLFDQSPAGWDIDRMPRILLTCTPTTIVRRMVDSHQPPLAAWVQDLFSGINPTTPPGNDLQTISVRARNDLILVSVRVRDAIRLAPAALEDRTIEAYDTIARQLSSDTWHPVRFWNHVPGINDLMTDGRDRYMVFNAGRYHAFAKWYGGPEQFDRLVATASGIGHRGRDLFVHCLAMKQPGVAVENPRQIPPYRYSRRFGPLPPAFARATVLPASESLPGRILVGGTASVRGEDSMHLEDLAKQLDETFANLASIAAAAAGWIDDGNGHPRPALARFRDLRAYVPDDSHIDAVASAVSAAFPSLARLELLRADLCRPELLVEIEGIAD